jgi:hypothetical protein
MQESGLSNADIVQFIFILLVVGAGVVGIALAAFKKEK